MRKQRHLNPFFLPEDIPAVEPSKVHSRISAFDTWMDRLMATVALLAGAGIVILVGMWLLTSVGWIAGTR